MQVLIYRLSILLNNVVVKLATMHFPVSGYFVESMHK